MKKHDMDICAIQCIHTDVVSKLQNKPIDEKHLENLADFFKVMGDYTRIRMIHALAQSELCVCDLAYLLGMSQSAISHQLRFLKRASIVKNRKEGKIVYYSLADYHIVNLFNQAYEHVNGETCEILQERENTNEE